MTGPDECVRVAALADMLNEGHQSEGAEEDEAEGEDKGRKRKECEHGTRERECWESFFFFRPTAA